MTVDIGIMAGLGTRASNAIIIDLAERLRAIPGVTVLAGSYAEYNDFADWFLTSRARHRIIIGHSLGGSVAPEVARRARITIAAIFGFDPAENIAANLSQYRLTTVPGNVRIARAGYVPNGGLGGGQYVAETQNTHIENFPVSEGHLEVDDAIERHLEIEEFTRRLTEAQA